MLDSLLWYPSLTGTKYFMTGLSYRTASLFINGSNTIRWKMRPGELKCRVQHMLLLLDQQRSALLIGEAQAT